MKRFFFTTIALAAVAVGCTKSGLIESPQTYETPIAFEPYTGKAPVTKATVATTETIYDGFQVIGYEEANATSHAITVTNNPYLDRKVYVKYDTENEEYEMKEGKPVWRYDNAMYWPENKTLTFMAYGLNAEKEYGSPSTKTITWSSEKPHTKFVYAVPPMVAEQEDLVISPIMQGQSSANNPVVVKLYHALSRVGFKVKTEGSANVNVIIKDVRLKGTGLTSASFDLEDAVSVTTTGSGPDVTTAVSYKNDATDGNQQAVTGTDAIDYSLFDTGYQYTTLSYNDPSNPNSDTKDFPAFMTRSASTSTTVAVCANTTFRTSANITEGATNKTVDYDPAYISADAISKLASNEDRFMMIIPQTLSNAKVEVVYQLSGAEEQKAEINLGSFQFKAGKAYEFVFTVSTVAVGFGVEVGGWLPGFAADNGDTNFTEAEGYFPLIPVE